MAGATNTEQQQQPALADAAGLNENGDGDEEESEFSWSASSSSESEPDYDTDSDFNYDPTTYDEGLLEEEAVDDNSPEKNIRQFTEALESQQFKKVLQREERKFTYPEDQFDFPPDPERWREEDLQELWTDAPLEMTKPGWDPVFADEDDWEVIEEEILEGRNPLIAPFYIPYRKTYPVIPDNHYDISNPKSVIEELDRIEEFLKWVSYIFPDGSTYEGTVWDDLAHGKGVYVAKHGLVRYEGEWLRNDMEGHGVVEVEIPDVEPIPGSKLEAKMRAQGRIIVRDFMTPEDKKWLEMDIEDSLRLACNQRQIPYYERNEWVELFDKNQKGRYRYAGQWKHGRLHGCGVYEVNERIIYGRFYFGEYLEDSTGCDADISAVHAGIAEVAAAKARMFVNKPDGMVREARGPYGDPQHPYFYEEEDAWMAPGFVHQFYEAPHYWKTYVEEVDQEREMWLNSFYRSPLRIPMPAELEYWWSKADETEFVLINKDPEPDPDDPSKLIYTEDPLILHTPSGRLINFVEDEEHGIRLFWQPRVKEDEDVDPEKAKFLPLGLDEFYGKAAPVKEENKLMRLVSRIEDAVKPVLDRLGNWAEERKKASEMNMKLIEKELDFIEAQLCLEEEIEDIELELKLKQKEEQKRAVEEEDKDDSSPAAMIQDEADIDEVEDEEDDEVAPASFGSVSKEEAEKGAASTNERGSKSSSFSSLSMSLTAGSLVSLVLFRPRHSLLLGKQGGKSSMAKPFLGKQALELFGQERKNMVRFPSKFSTGGRMRVVQGQRGLSKRRNDSSQLVSLARMLTSCANLKNNIKAAVNVSLDDVHHQSVLSLHVPLDGATGKVVHDHQ